MTTVFSTLTPDVTGTICGRVTIDEFPIVQPIWYELRSKFKKVYGVVFEHNESGLAYSVDDNELSATSECDSIYFIARGEI